MSTRVKGKLNHFKYDDSQVHELLFLAAMGHILDHITGTEATKEKINKFLFMAVMSYQKAYKLVIGYKGNIWNIFVFATIHEMGRRCAYAKELLGIGFIGDGWDKILSDLQHHMWDQDVDTKFSENVTMPL